MKISGSIDGLKKGKLFLQKVGDSTLINVDSFETSKDVIVYVAKEINSSEGLYFKANYDMLTKLPNRNLLNDRFNLLLSQSKEQILN